MKENNTFTRRIFSSDLSSFDPEENGTLREHYLPILEVLYVGSCNGLICTACDDDYQYHSYKRFALVNPTTDQFRELPKLNSPHERKVFCGFGYDNHIDDYKIVRGVVFKVSDNSFNKARIEIFNLKSNSWRAIQDQHCSVVVEGTGVFLNGVLHWLDRVNNGGENEFRFEIIRFDLVEERFLDAMPLPSQIGHYGWYRTLIVLDECLCVHTLGDEEYFPIEGWKMVNYGVQNSWTRIYHFSDDTLTYYENLLQLLYITKNGCLWFVKNACDVIVYNPKNKSMNVHL